MWPFNSSVSSIIMKGFWSKHWPGCPRSRVSRLGAAVVQCSPGSAGEARWAAGKLVHMWMLKRISKGFHAWASLDNSSVFRDGNQVAHPVRSRRVQVLLLGQVKSSMLAVDCGPYRCSDWSIPHLHHEAVIVFSQRQRHHRGHWILN